MARWLTDAGYPARHADGGDDTIAAFDAAPTQVLVVTATLALGDTASLLGALREKTGRRLRVVLIGDTTGPIRTALDAVELGADRFLRAPAEPKALIFATKACVNMGGEQRGSVHGTGGRKEGDVVSGEAGGVAAAITSGAGSGAFGELPSLAPGPIAPPRAITNAGVAAHAITARLNEALAVAITSHLEVTIEDTVVRALRDILDDDKDDHGDHPTPRVDEARAPTMPGLPPQRPPDAVTAAPVGEIFGHGDDELPPLPVDAPEEPEPPREPTQIMSGRRTGTPPPPVAAVPPPWLASGPTPTGATPPPKETPPPIAPRADVTVDLGVGPAVKLPPGLAARAATPAPRVEGEASALPLPEVTAPDAAPTGTFARELRRHMNAIEQRLFGENGGTYDSSGLDDPTPPLDLDAIGVDTVPGLTAELVRIPRETAISVEDDVVVMDEMELRRSAATGASSNQGELGREDVATLLGRLWESRTSGRLSLRHGDVEKAIYVEDGRPIFAASNVEHDRMSDLLLREGKVTAEQHRHGLAVMHDTGRRIGEILVDLGYLKRRELLPAVRRHLEDVVYSLFAWTQGTWTLSPRDSAEDEKIKLAAHPAGIVLEGIRRKMGPQRLRERLGPPSVVVVPVQLDTFATAFADAELSVAEREALELFDGRRSLAEIMAASELDETAVYQLAYGAVALRLARPLQLRRESTDSGRTPPPTLGSAADLRIDRERVRAKHAHVACGDYFQVLGVRRDATTFEIRRAYESARKDYAADAFPIELARELGHELEEIATVLDEAFRVLREDRVRSSYLTHLRD